MSNPFRAHTRFVQAQEAARMGGSARHASGYDQMLLQLAEDRRRFKGVQSTVKKAQLKLEILPKYAAWINGVITADTDRQDDVLMFLMVWRIDAGDFAGGLQIAAHAIKHGWVLPQALGRRNVQTVVAEELADQAEAAQRMKAEFPADVLLQALSLTDALDMPDQSRARLHKAIAAVISESRPAAALNHYTFALQLDPRCGVKKDKERLERHLRNSH